MLLVLQQEHHVTEKKEEKPTPMNAFDLISMSKGLNLGNLFNVEQVSAPKALYLSLSVLTFEYFYQLYFLMSQKKFTSGKKNLLWIICAMSSNQGLRQTRMTILKGVTDFSLKFSFPVSNPSIPIEV